LSEASVCRNESCSRLLFEPVAVCPHCSYEQTQTEALADYPQPPSPVEAAASAEITATLPPVPDVTDPELSSVAPALSLPEPPKHRENMIEPPPAAASFEPAPEPVLRVEPLRMAGSEPPVLFEGAPPPVPERIETAPTVREPVVDEPPLIAHVAEEPQAPQSVEPLSDASHEPIVRIEPLHDVAAERDVAPKSAAVAPEPNVEPKLEPLPAPAMEIARTEEVLREAEVVREPEVLREPAVLPESQVLPEPQNEPLARAEFVAKATPESVAHAQPVMDVREEPPAEPKESMQPAAEATPPAERVVETQAPVPVHVAPPEIVPDIPLRVEERSEPAPVASTSQKVGGRGKWIAAGAALCAIAIAAVAIWSVLTQTESSETATPQIPPAPPQAVSEPQPTAQPEATAQPGSPTQPEATVQPEATAQPEPPKAPEPVAPAPQPVATMPTPPSTPAEKPATPDVRAVTPAPTAPSPTPRPSTVKPEVASVPRTESLATQPPQPDPKLIECRALVRAGQRALSDRNYDTAIGNAAEALSVAAQCPGAQQLASEAKKAKSEAQARTVIE
jgi:hypothetical protein